MSKIPSVNELRDLLLFRCGMTRPEVDVLLQRPELETEETRRSLGEMLDEVATPARRREAIDTFFSQFGAPVFNPAPIVAGEQVETLEVPVSETVSTGPLEPLEAPPADSDE